MPRACAAHTGLNSPATILQSQAQDVLEPWAHKRPEAHIAVLLLRPHKLGSVLVLANHFSQLASRKGTQLFQPDDHHLLNYRESTHSEYDKKVNHYSN